MRRPTILAAGFFAVWASAALPLAAKGPAPAYRWDANVAVAPAEEGRQRAETALVSDGKEKVWLSFLDAEYKRGPQGQWLAWPRKVMLYVSTDQGRSFGDPKVLAEPGGDEALAIDPRGTPYGSWVEYFKDQDNKLQQRIAVKRIGPDGAAGDPILCLPWDAETRHDQSHILVGADGVLHILGTDISPRTKGRPTVLYARSPDGGKTCADAQRLESLGSLPQVGVGGSRVVIAGPDGVLVSADGGATFSAAKRMPIGDKLARVAVSPDGKTFHAVGDNGWNGLWVQTSTDGGLSWRRVQVALPGEGKAWRYPALHVDRAQRVHVVWMDDRDGYGAIHHAYSDDRGKTFSAATRVSDARFPFPAKAPPPPPGTQDGTWIGDYIGLASVGDRIVVAWSDQRAGPGLSTVYTAVGAPVR
ncbi:MAG: hypothetical protein HQL33_06065 [Alphaproteobacteria bacterium]|nr:hypothetical protein [Alphaproteobacteria bacterium]